MSLPRKDNAASNSNKKDSLVEVKEREVKGISTTQLSLLEEFINSKDGILIDGIKESGAADLGTKILYLKRSITKDCNAFLLSLDKLYNPKPDNKDIEKSNLELIMALKKINDMCFNNDVSYNVPDYDGDKIEYGVTSCITRDFGRLRSTAATLAIEVQEAKAFKKEITRIINENIKIIKKGRIKKTNKQIRARKELEKSIIGAMGWRNLLELPISQRKAAIIISTTSSLFSSRERIALARNSLTINSGASVSIEAKLGVTNIFLNYEEKTSSHSSRNGLFLTPSEEDLLRSTGYLPDFHFFSGRNPFASRSSMELTADQKTEHTLNPAQSYALEALLHYGITREHFTGKIWFCMYEHAAALIYLMKNRVGMPKMTAAEAMQELNELNFVQAKAISKGLSRADIIDLHYEQVNAYMLLHSKGLTRNHLLGKSWFNSADHTSALIHLMTKRGIANMSADTAMKELDHLNWAQAEAISKGLMRSDVVDLNLYQASALGDLHIKGLTRQHLLGKSWFNDFMYCNALEVLMTRRGENNISADIAMVAIQDKSFSQLIDISTNSLLESGLSAARFYPR